MRRSGKRIRGWAGRKMRERERETRSDKDKMTGKQRNRLFKIY